MTEPLGKDALLQRTREERAALDDVYAKLTEDELCAPVLDGGWTMKDVLVHVATWERRILSGFEAARRGEPPEPGPQTQHDTDAFNERNFLENRERTLADVIAEAGATHGEYVALIESLPDRALEREVPGAPGLTVEALLRGNGEQHYREHLDAIEAWWAGQGA
jgi:hypothetical protein